MASELLKASRRISVLNEKPLHACLKAAYAEPGDNIEVVVDGYLVDIVRGDLLIEVQTRNFAAIKRKLLALTAGHRVRLVYPVTCEKWIVRQTGEGSLLGRRKSPRRGRLEDIFDELVSFPELVARPGFSLDLLLIREEELREHGPARWRRRGWATRERRLLEIIDRRLIETPQDLAALLPADLAEPFTTSDLAAAVGRPRRVAQRMAYCLRALGLIEMVSKRGNALEYVRSPEAGGIERGSSGTIGQHLAG